MENHPHPTDHYLQLGAHRVRYWTAGDHGTPVVLVHALGASVEYWAKALPALARQHRVYALDLLGFGLSDKPDVPYGEPYLAGAVRDFADALGLERFHLIGNSMGGAVAQRVTRENPHRVDHLILVCSGGLGRGISPRVRLLSVPLLGERIARPREEFTRRLVKGCVVNRHAIPQSLLDASYAHARSPGALRAFLRTLRNGIRFDGQRPDIVDAHRAYFSKLRSPTLVLWGDRDPIIPNDYLEAIRTIPQLQVHKFENCGHYPQLELPEEFCAVVLDFLPPSNGGQADRSSFTPLPRASATMPIHQCAN